MVLSNPFAVMSNIGFNSHINMSSCVLSNSSLCNFDVTKLQKLLTGHFCNFVSINFLFKIS